LEGTPRSVNIRCSEACSSRRLAVGADEKRRRPAGKPVGELVDLREQRVEQNDAM
jgi:hypothetical protein